MDAITNDLKRKVLQEILAHLESKDGMELRPPKVMGVEVDMVGKDPMDKKPMDEMHDAMSAGRDPMAEGDDDKGPMEKLMDAKGTESDLPNDVSPGDMKPGHGMSPEEIEELLREYEK